MNDNLGFAFQKLAFSLLRRSDELLQAKLGIGYAQYKLLEVLAEHPHSNQRFVASSLMQTEASISRQVKLMQNAGLLRVGTPAENKRMRVIALSTKGSEVHARGAQLLNECYLRAFQKLRPDEAQSFLDLIQKLGD